ncbi:MAG TPA: thiamine pyrophosphate-dependent enzyme [Candidatus Limnocylindrales bacterium]|nr:thiamine pyrophosphate-dependent enzyme [Candidatus Limnocylindrales bacterium]
MTDELEAVAPEFATAPLDQDGAGAFELAGPRAATADPAADAAGDPGVEPSEAAATAQGTDLGTDAPPADDLTGSSELEAAPAPEADPAAGEETEPGEDTEQGAVLEAEPPAPPQAMSVGRMFADAVRRAGVRWAFTVPGESFLGLLEGLEAVGVNIVATRHEGAAAFMAEAHAQLTGRPAVCIGTRAVGGSNLAIGIHTAFADSSPMFAFVGQVERAARGREGFQEIDVTESIGRLAKWSAEPTDVTSALEVATQAVDQALNGRPGPVVLSVAEDLLDDEVPAGVAPLLSRVPPPRPTDEQVGEVLHLLADAQRPVILAGAGVLRARTSNDLVRLAELLRVPVVASWRRGDVISNDNPLYLGMTGYGAPATVRERLEGADAMLVVGSRLGEISTYGWTIPGPGTRWAHVDIAPGRISPTLTPAAVTITADARLFLRAAVARLESRGVLDAASTDARSARNAEDRAAWEAATAIDGHPWAGPGVHPGKVITTLRSLLPDDGIVTTDAGSFGTWAARGFRFRRPGTFLGSTSGAMGYGLPAAIAAGLVHRDRAVVALVGDGGLGMTLAEIETAVRTGLRTVVLVFDNQRYGMIRTYQDRRAGESAPATDLGPVDFAAAARALGAKGVRVEEDAAFEPALRQALVGDRPTVIHLIVDRRWEGVDSRP